MAPQVDEVVMHELSKYPATLYDLPTGIHPKEVPVIPVSSAPIYHAAHGAQGDLFHWVIADFGHCMWTRCLPRATKEVEHSLAHLQQKHLSDVVQPYALRAPEVILGLGWGPPIDIWSLGCMLLSLLPTYLLDHLLTASIQDVRICDRPLAFQPRRQR